MNQNTYEAMQALLDALIQFAAREEETIIFEAARNLSSALSTDETIVK